MTQDITLFAGDFYKIENEVKKVILGQDELIRNVLVCMVACGNALLEGLPGLGKTQLVKTIGHVLDLEFSRIQFTPDLMPADVTGTEIFVKNETNTGAFKFQKGPVFANIVLADEINRATPKTQSSLLEAMQEKTVTVGNTTYQLPIPFFVLATQNPIELEGTYPLPEAQMDRFLMKLDVKFPDKNELYNIVQLTAGTEIIKLDKLYNADKILLLNEAVKTVPISKSVAEYAMDLIIKTHPEEEEAPAITKKYVKYGVSPRGAQAIIIVARIYALLDGRYNVAFEDIKKAALPTLRHRILLNFDAISDDVSVKDILKELL